MEVLDATRTERVGMDQTLEFAEIAIGDTKPLGAIDQQQLMDVGAALATAVQVGAMQRCLEMTVEYSKQRVQFGRPIGSYQALKHRMADCLVDLYLSQSVSWAACWAAANRELDLPQKASTAKVWCSEALNRVAAETVQLHGGIAITWEHDAHRYLKRAHAFSTLFGQPHEHRRRLAGLL